jgi:hypothetical protein
MAGRSAGHPRLACGEKGVDGRDERGHDAEKWSDTIEIRVSGADLTFTIDLATKRTSKSDH